MNIPSEKTAGRRQVSPILIAIVLVVLVAFIVWRAWAAFSGPRAGRLPPPPTQNIAFLQQKARECQGDFSKLSPEDQAKVQKITQGFGPAAMASTYRKALQKSP